MAIIVPDVARFSINQTLEGRAVVNVIDMQIDTTGSTMSRDDAIVNQAKSILTEWDTYGRVNQVDDLTADSISYVDLNSASGITGNLAASATVTWPKAGSKTGSPLPANTALLVKKQTPSRRGARSGRMYVAGIPEEDTDTANGNRLSSAFQTSFTSSMAAFKSGVEELDTLGTAFESWLVVVHITARDASGNPTAGDYTRVDTLVVDGLLATQRRRLRG